MAEKATKKTHVEVGGQQVPADMVVQNPDKPNTSLAVQDEQMIAEIKQLSNSGGESNKEFPSLKLQHITTPDGEPNPLRGHFTVTRKNDLGEWEIQDLGEEIKMQFLLRHYFLKMTKNGGKEIYTSAEFENEMEVVALWKRGEDKSELFGEGTPYDLRKRFLKKDDKNRVRSELNVLSKLYVLVGGEVMSWKLSLMGTISWSKYNKLVPFTAGVITSVGRTEEKSGSVKYFVPVFKADQRITDLSEVKSNIELLKDMLPKKHNDTFVIEENEDVPFKG